MFTNSLGNINKEYLALAVFTILIGVFYGNTLSNGFILDDQVVVAENIYIQSLRYLPKVVTGCIWEYALGGCKGETLHYRPIHNLSYLLTYQISSEAWFFHLVNLLYFLIIVFLIFVLIKLITKNFTLSFLTALFFLIHPVNNEVVNWIAAVSELTFAIFVLLTLIFYIKYRHTDSFQNFLFTILFYFLALLSKETATFVLLPIIILLDLIFFKKKIKELFSWKELKNYLLFIVPSSVYLLMREAVVGGFGGLARGGDYFGEFSFTERIYYFFWLFTQYLKKLFYPSPLIFFNELKEKPNLLSGRFFILLGIFLLFFIISYFLRKKGKSFLAFSQIWIFIFILPMLVFYNIVGENIFAERYLFIPSIGFAFIVAYFLNYLWSKNKILKAAMVILTTFLIIVSWLIIYPRNKTWKDNVTFFRTNLELNPNAHSLREHLANELLGRGEVEAAKVEFEEIVERNSDWKYISRTYNSLGNYYQGKEDLDKALEYYQKAAETIEEGNYKPYNNIGAFYFDNEEYLKALTYFCKALQVAPEASEPKSNFNQIASMIEGVSSENFMFLYMDFMQGGVFQKSEGNKIQYRNKICIANSCFYIFISQIEEEETFLPSLIMGNIFPSEIIKIKNSFFNSETGVIVVSVNEEYKDSTINFLFPTCDGIYYETTTRP